MKLSRRTFLRLVLLSGIAAGAEVIYKTTEPIGFDKWFRWMLRGNAARLFAPKVRVALAACSSYGEPLATDSLSQPSGSVTTSASLAETLRAAWSAAQLPDLRDRRVVLKPNLVDFVQGHPSHTHPRVLEAMIHLAREQGAREVIVAEGSTFRRDSLAILDATGYTEVLAREKVNFVDLNYDDLVSVPLIGGYTGLKALFVSKTIADADLLVSMPKMKTHHWTGISVSVKNLFGIVPGIKYGWPKNTLHMHGIPAFLAELADSLMNGRNGTLQVCAVVDGIVGTEGDGPLYGDAVQSGVLVLGADLLAVDATCARLMGFNPKQIDYLDFAAWAGVGTIDDGRIELVNGDLAGFQKKYERPPRLG